MAAAAAQARGCLVATTGEAAVEAAAAGQAGLGALAAMVPVPMEAMAAQAGLAEAAAAGRGGVLRMAMVRGAMVLVVVEAGGRQDPFLEGSGRAEQERQDK